MIAFFHNDEDLEAMNQAILVRKYPDDFKLLSTYIRRIQRSVSSLLNYGSGVHMS